VIECRKNKAERAGFVFDTEQKGGVESGLRLTRAVFVVSAERRENFGMEMASLTLATGDSSRA